MTPRQRSAFSRFLADFVETHPGTRIGSLFGRPAAFAGARVFATVTADGLDCRIPHTRVPRGTSDRLMRSGSRPDWVTVSWAPAVSDAPLVLLLEASAAYVSSRIHTPVR